MEEKTNQIAFSGWHGTDERLALQTVKTNFKESTGEHHWLGEGVYFFTVGIGEPLLHAQNWAILEAFKKRYTKYAVVYAVARVNDDAVLDLRQQAGLDIFNEHRRFVLDIFRKRNKRAKFSLDGKIFKHLRSVAGIELVLKNMYVQLTKEDRIQQVASRIENCTFLCVYNPNKNIDISTISIVKSDKVQETN